MSTDLFSVVERGGGRRVDEGREERGANIVSDAGQVSRLIVEAVSELAMATAEEVERWRLAGHRLVVMEEHPWIVERVVASQLTEEQFKWRVKAALQPTSGTAVYGLRQRQYNGDWRVARVQCQVDAVVKLDQRRERPRGQLPGESDIEWDPDAPAPADFVGVRKACVRWVVEWIDAAGEVEIKYDVHGREPQKMDVKVESGAERAMLAVAEKMGAVAEKLASPAVEVPVVVKKRDRKAEVERARARKGLTDPPP